MEDFSESADFDRDDLEAYWNEIDNDAQPYEYGADLSYYECQDFYGGDGWDHGQYDEVSEWFRYRADTDW